MCHSGMEWKVDLASRCNVSSVCTAGHTEDLITMAVQLLCLWPQSVLKEMILNWRLCPHEDE